MVKRDAYVPGANIKSSGKRISETPPPANAPIRVASVDARKPRIRWAVSI